MKIQKRFNKNLKFWLVMLAILAIMVACQKDEEEPQSTIEAPNTEETQEEEKEAKEVAEEVESEPELTQQQHATIDALNDFPTFISAYKELGEVKTPTWDTYLSGEKVSWSGTVMELGSAQIWVWGTEDYQNQTWDEVSSSGNDAYHVFVADFEEGAPSEIKVGDQVTVEGLLESRDDYDLNVHWKLYQATITDIISAAINLPEEEVEATADETEIEHFQNCTELRKVYPNGVDSNHPAYQAKMDRDKDNFACEK